jgi:hypothetical protein
MATRNRIPSQNRDDFLLETNFDEDGALTKAYNQLNENPDTTTVNRTRMARSNVSIDRYSDMDGTRRRKGVLL